MLFQSILILTPCFVRLRSANVTYQNTTDSFCVNCAPDCTTANQTSTGLFRPYNDCVDVKTTMDCQNETKSNFTNLGFRAVRVLIRFGSEKKCLGCIETEENPYNSEKCQYGSWTLEADNSSSFCDCSRNPASKSKDCKIKEVRVTIVFTVQKSLEVTLSWQNGATDNWQVIGSDVLKMQKVIDKRCDYANACTGCQATKWTAWSNCTGTCYAGHRYRTSSLAFPTNTFCEHSSLQTQECDHENAHHSGCDEFACKKVHKKDARTKWSSWSPCSQSCADFHKETNTVHFGTQSRTREVDSRGCLADKRDIRRCNTQPCPSTELLKGCFFSEWTFFPSDECLQTQRKPALCKRLRRRNAIALNSRQPCHGQVEELVQIETCTSCKINYTAETSHTDRNAMNTTTAILTGFICAVVFLIVIIAVTAWLLRRRKKKKKKEQEEEMKLKLKMITMQERRRSQRSSRKKKRKGTSTSTFSSTESRKRGRKKLKRNQSRSARLLRSSYERIRLKKSDRRSVTPIMPDGYEIVEPGAEDMWSGSRKVKSETVLKTLPKPDGRKRN